MSEAAAVMIMVAASAAGATTTAMGMTRPPTRGTQASVAAPDEPAAPAQHLVGRRRSNFSTKPAPSRDQVGEVAHEANVGDRKELQRRESPAHRQHEPRGRTVRAGAVIERATTAAAAHAAASGVATAAALAPTNSEPYPLPPGRRRRTGTQRPRAPERGIAAYSADQRSAGGRGWPTGAFGHPVGTNPSRASISRMRSAAAGRARARRRSPRPGRRS